MIIKLLAKLSRPFIFMALLTPAFSSAKLVEFIINIPFSTPDQSNIYLTGDISGHCNWQPTCLKMKDLGSGSYSISITIPDEIQTLNYKVTRGSWDNEAANSYSAPYGNFTVNLATATMPIVQNIIHWKDLAPLSKSNNIQTAFLFSTELDKNKEISIYLPPNYENSSKHFPVIYMHDGQNVFDPRSSSFGVEWSIDETMNKLISRNEINEAIIVAIHTNNTDRYLEYDYFSQGKKYSDFIINGVVPFIDQNYRTISNRESRYLMGSSMGALISLMMLIDRPDMFSKGAGLSFPAHINERAIFRFLAGRQDSKLPAFDFYMDHGDYGIDTKYSTSANDLYSTLKVQEQVKVKYSVYPFANHSEADWARRAYIPLKYLLN